MEIKSLEDVYNIINKPDGEFVTYIQEYGLIKKNFRCKFRNCRSVCKLSYHAGQNSINSSFYCKKCKKQYSALNGTFFERMNLPVRQVFLIIWCWSCNLRTGATSALLNMRKGTIIQIYRFIRDIVSWKLLQNIELFQLGGEGHIVEIDESVLTKGKGNSGVLKDNWIIAMYDTTTKRGYIKYVKNRSSELIIPIIQRIVQPGSEIWTDEWQAYGSLKDCGYIHKTVNRSQFVKDPITGVSTNHVEGYWSVLKQFLGRLGVMGSPFLPEYIDLFMWREIYGSTPKDVMKNILLQIAEKCN